MSEITGTSTEQAGSSPDLTPGKTYTHEEYEAATTRARKSAETKLAAKEAELAQLREAQKTEGERAMDRVRQETAQEWAGKLQAQTIASELKVKLMERGLPANAAHLVKAENEIGSIEEIDAAIDATLRSNEWLKPGKAQPAHSGQGGAPRGTVTSGIDDPNHDWTAEEISQVRRANQYSKYRESIQRSQARRG